MELRLKLSKESSNPTVDAKFYPNIVRSLRYLVQGKKKGKKKVNLRECLEYNTELMLI
jgi:hypothetical protein